MHAVAELLLAGPQYEQSKTIQLRVTPGGFGTVAAPAVRVQGASVVVDGRAVSLSGRTVAEVAADAGLTARLTRRRLLAEACGLTEDYTLIGGREPRGRDWRRRSARRRGAGGVRTGRAAVLWPEHFDLGITVDQVNYGVSPGDADIGVPYAYVGPWTTSDLTGAFWNTSFGAARPAERGR